MCSDFLKQYYNVGEKLAVILYQVLYTHIALIAMQGHQTKSKDRTETICGTESNMGKQ